MTCPFIPYPTAQTTFPSRAGGRWEQRHGRPGRGARVRTTGDPKAYLQSSPTPRAGRHAPHRELGRVVGSCRVRAINYRATARCLPGALSFDRQKPHSAPNSRQRDGAVDCRLAGGPLLRAEAVKRVRYFERAKPGMNLAMIPSTTLA